MKREKYLDIAKGIATIMVIIGHVDFAYTEAWLTTWVYSFHMPLFFIVSGILFRPEKYDSFKTFLKKKAKGLIIPYLILSLIIFIANMGLAFLKTKAIDGEATFKSFAGIFVGWRGTEWYNGLWFVSTLFFAEVLIYGIFKLARRAKRKGVFLSCATVILMLAGFIVMNNIKGAPLSLDIVPLCAGTIIIGYGIKRIYERWKWIQGLGVSIVLLAINIITCIWNYNITGFRVDIYTSIVGNWLLFIVSSISGSLFILNISRVIRENKTLERIGRRSLIYYGLQGAIALPVAKNGWAFLIKKAGIPNIKIISCTIVTIGACIILRVCSFFCERIMPTVFRRQK